MILNMPGKRPENMKEMLRYLNLLEEQLRYVLANIDGADITAGTIDVDRLVANAGSMLDISSNQAIKLVSSKVDDAGKRVAELRVDADKISTKVEDAEGRVSELSQTVNGFDQRVEDAEGNVSQLSQTVSGFEQRVADTEGNVSTLQQTAKGLENRVQDAEGNVSTLQKTAKGLESKVEDAEGNISSLQQSVDGFSQTVKKAVDDIEIGGRNLLKNSKGDFVMPPQNDGTASDNYYSKSFRFDPVVGETYTFAADVEITDGDFDAISVYPYPGGTLTNVPIPANGRITHTFTVNVDTITQILAYAGVAGETHGNGVIFRNVKIEKGNKATDWTAAPEDLETRVLNAETAITETADEIKLKASKTEVDNLTGRITDAEAQIVTQAGEIQLTATEVSNISIGGTNILPGYADERSVSRNIRIPVRSILEPHVGKEICISFECKATIARAISMYAYQSSGISIRNTFSFTPSTTEFTRHSFKTTVHDWGQKEGLSTGEIIFHDSAGEQNYTIRKVKIELGNKPTDWSPCPDDPVKTLKNTAMTLNGNGIEMSTTGHFRLYANDGKNSRIKLGGDNSTANFSVDESGMLGAISGDFAQGLSVGNQPVWTRGNIIISSSQPTGVHDVLWIQPMQGVQQTSHSYLNTSQDHFTGGNAMNFTLAPDSASVLSSGGSYSYSLSLRMTLGQDTTTVKDFTISAVLSTGAGSVTLTGQSVSLTGWKNVNLTLTGTSGVNLCASSGNITAAVTVSGHVGNTYMYIPRNTSLILTSKNTAASSAGAQTCTIHYIQ